MLKAPPFHFGPVTKEMLDEQERLIRAADHEDVGPLLDEYKRLLGNASAIVLTQHAFIGFIG